MTTSVEASGREHWTELVGHRPDVKLEGVNAFDAHLVRYERREGVRRIVVTVYGGDERELAMPEEVYDTGPRHQRRVPQSHPAFCLHLPGDAQHRVRRRPRHG